MAGRCVVTGAAGFIGAHLVRRLVGDGCAVVAVDNMARGDPRRLAEVAGHIDLQNCDVRDADALTRACRGADVVFHLAAINGTENFYTQPELVLDVGLRGALAVVEACQAAEVPDLVLASSAEVYQTAPTVPTDETTSLMLPDSLNPRYSYGGSKIVSELIAFNYGRRHFRKVQVFRPHNVYGPDMGWKHVIPQFLMRALAARESGDPAFPIESDGAETRAFAFIDDVVEGILTMYRAGGHREIYHVGTETETTIADLARLIGQVVGVDLVPQPGRPAPGATRRRCPDISKLRALGFAPVVNLREGLRRTAPWYEQNHETTPDNALM